MPRFAQVNQIRKELFPESFKGRKRDVDLMPEEWIARGQALVESQRRLEFELGDWWNAGEDKYGQAAALLSEVEWKGPPVAVIRRKATVARTYPPEVRTADLSFDVYDKALAIGRPTLIATGVSESDVLASVSEVRARERLAKEKQDVGQEIEQDELAAELLKFFPRLWNGLVNHIGHENEAQAIAWAQEWLSDRKFAIRGL